MSLVHLLAVPECCRGHVHEVVHLLRTTDHVLHRQRPAAACDPRGCRHLQYRAPRRRLCRYVATLWRENTTTGNVSARGYNPCRLDRRRPVCRFHLRMRHRSWCRREWRRTTPRTTRAAFRAVRAVAPGRWIGLRRQNRQEPVLHAIPILSVAILLLTQLPCIGFPSPVLLLLLRLGACSVGVMDFGKGRLRHVPNAGQPLHVIRIRKARKHNRINEIKGRAWAT